MDTKDWIAIYAAFVSTAVACWNVYTYKIDKGKLKVRCYVDYDWIDGRRISHHPLIAYELTNVGRKPLYIQKIGGELRGENRHQFEMSNVDKFPLRLEPGEQVVFYLTEESVDFNKIKTLHVYDTFGKAYRPGKAEFELILKTIRSNC